MDLRSPSRHKGTLDPAGNLPKIPNKVRYIALSKTLEVATTTETSGLLLHLLDLCQPTEITPPRGVFAPLLARRRDARAAEDRAIAQRARADILARWHHLPPEARRAALAMDADWGAHARRLLEGDPPAIDAILAFAADTYDDLAARPGVPALLLSSGNRRAVALAEDALLPRILEGLAPPPADWPRALRDRADTHEDHHLGSDEADHALARAVESARIALQTFASHERTPLALAALLLLDRPACDRHARTIAPVARVLADPEHPAFPALRRALKRDPSPAVRRIAWRVLLPGPLALAALERLGRAETAREHDAVLANTHLLDRPERRRALAGNARPATRAGAGTIRASALAPLVPPASVTLNLPAERGLARLLAAADPATATTLHERLLTSRSEHARLTAARLADPAALADLCLDADASVATVAALRHSTAGIARPTDRAPAPHRERTARTLARSPHPMVRRIAREDLGTADLLDDRGAPTLRAIAMARAEPARLGEELWSLVGADRGVAAIRAAERLGVLARWRDRLEGLVETGTDPRLAATVAAALGSIREAGALPLVERALEHADPRVRANAVESLEQLAVFTDPADRLTEIKQTPEHRARANAIRALERLRLADEGAAFAEVARMLFDSRAPHRLAAVWLAERLLCDPRRAQGPGDPAWESAARSVAAIARTDDDPHIRARAVRCARRLLAEMDRPARRPDPALSNAAARLRRFAAEGVSPDHPPAAIGGER
jgi:hypothetical protein